MNKLNDINTFEDQHKFILVSVKFTWWDQANSIREKPTDHSNSAGDGH